MSLTFAVGIVGTLTGLAAGLAGTYLAIVSSVGPRERAFMVRGAWVCWAGVALVLAARFVLPSAWPVVTVLGALVLPRGLRWWSDRQAAIRHDEHREQRQAAVVDHTSRPL